jgi:hypothetical protein
MNIDEILTLYKLLEKKNLEILEQKEQLTNDSQNSDISRRRTLQISERAETKI